MIFLYFLYADAILRHRLVCRSITFLDITPFHFFRCFIFTLIFLRAIDGFHYD